MNPCLVSHERLRYLVLTSVDSVLAQSHGQPLSTSVPFQDQAYGLQLPSQSSAALRSLHKDIATLHHSIFVQLDHDPDTEDAFAKKRINWLQSCDSNSAQTLVYPIGRLDQLPGLAVDLSNIGSRHPEYLAPTPSENDYIKSEPADEHPGDDAPSCETSAAIAHNSPLGVAKTNDIRGLSATSEERIFSECKQVGNGPPHPSHHHSANPLSTASRPKNNNHRILADAPPLSSFSDDDHHPPPAHTAKKRPTAADFFFFDQQATPEDAGETEKTKSPPPVSSTTMKAVAALIREEKAKKTTGPRKQKSRQLSRRKPPPARGRRKRQGRRRSLFAAAAAASSFRR
ncbi:MAG: hypothetical protein L6R35_004677 [Caloplaca aegaea]|nr:MAG: hypothetical protein L6R35_004677 [Caloplaca aegaea]